MGPEEKPPVIFKHLDREGRKPMFMFRKAPDTAQGLCHYADGTDIEGRGVKSGSCVSPGVAHDTVKVWLRVQWKNRNVGQGRLSLLSQ